MTHIRNKTSEIRPSLTRETLLKSTNHVVKELAETDFYILPESNESFIADFKRNKIHLDVFGQIINEKKLKY